jgi:hypothetical protein
MLRSEPQLLPSIKSFILMSTCISRMHPVCGPTIAPPIGHHPSPPSPFTAPAQPGNRDRVRCRNLFPVSKLLGYSYLLSWVNLPPSQL